MNKILFFADYPLGDNIKEGMHQRIKNIDTEVTGFKRTYVDVSAIKYIRKTKIILEDGQVVIYRLNMLVHLLLLISLVKEHTNIYFHSIIGYRNVFWVSGKKKNLILDLHGSVPEEFGFQGKKMMSFVFQKIEERLFKKGDSFIFVSEEMRDYYLEKYPHIIKKNLIIKSICSSGVFKTSVPAQAKALKESLGIKENDVVFIYSGNVQKWQNIDLTIDNMLAISRDNYFFIFLTLDPIKIENLIKEKTQNKKVRYIVKSVLPSELYLYYTISNYGYILRDEHVLNRVAAPTKLIEYLYYGIIPIVKYARIGDSFRLGYSYKNINEDLNGLCAEKSEQNVLVAKKLMSMNRDTEITQLFQ